MQKSSSWIKRPPRDYAKVVLARGRDCLALGDDIRGIVTSFLVDYDHCSDIKERSEMMLAFVDSMRYARAWEFGVAQIAHTLAVACVEREVSGETYHRALIALVDDQTVKIRRALAS